MSRNLRLQVVLNAVDKLTRPFRSAQESNKRLAGAVRQSRDALKDLNRQAGQIDGFRKTKQQLTETQQAYQAATQRAAALAREMNASGNPTRQQAEALKRAQREAGQLKNRFEQLQRSTQQQRSALQANGISTNQLGQAQRRLNSDIARTTQQLQRQEQQLRRSAEQERRMAAAKGGYQKTMDVRNKMAGTGATAMATGGASLYASKKFLAPGYDFDYGMSTVQALTRLNNDSPELKKLREQARELGATTSFTANDVAGGMGFLAMAGYTPDKIQKAMPSMLDLAKAAKMDNSLAEVADIASNIQSAYKIPADEMQRVSDVLTFGFTTSNTDLRMLGETMKFVGPAAQAAGQDFESMVAAVGMLGNVGIQASTAGTSLRMSLLRLAKQPKEAKKALNELGVSIADNTGKMKPLPVMLSEIDAAFKKKGINGVGNVKKLAYINNIFGVESSAAMIALLDKQGEIDPENRIEAYADRLKKSKGTASTAAKTMADNLRGDVQNAISAWEEIGISVYDTVKSPLRELAGNITTVLRGIGDWTKKNPELTATLTKIALALGVILAVGGAIVLMLAAMLGPVAMLKLSMSVLGIKGAGAFGLLAKGLKAVGLALFGIGKALLTNPLFLAAAVIAGIAYAIYKNWDTVAAFFKKLWADIVSSCDAAWKWISNIISRAWEGIKNYFLNYTLVGLIYKNWDGIKKYMSDLWETVKTTIKTKWDQIITDIQNLPATMKQAASDMIDSVINGINEKWTELKNKFGELKQMAKDALTPDWLIEAKKDPKFVTAVEATQKTTMSGGIRNANWSIQPKKYAGAYDSGGHIPRGQWGIVGENGPEVVDGPANVTGRKNTAALAMLALSTLSQPIAAAPAQTAVGSVSSAYSSQQNAAPVINIYPTPAHTAQDIAREVARQLEVHTRRQQASRRSGYGDTEEF
ncbi:phage tail tape measure protein [Morganella morganii subsp. morganii]|nr:phage tail tape measure protein [Morganella morganii]QWM15961.1 phage tail tape measure protein [Morganella morganii subsp. morganii]